jgi:hypothetical protein
MTKENRSARVIPRFDAAREMVATYYVANVQRDAVGSTNYLAIAEK